MLKCVGVGDEIAVSDVEAVSSSAEDSGVSSGISLLFVVLEVLVDG